MARAQIGIIRFHVLFHLKRQLFPAHSVLAEAFDSLAFISPRP